MIRPCTGNDLDAILAIINDAAQAYKGHIPDDRWREPYMSREYLEHELDAGVRFWDYEETGRLLGVMGIQDVKDVTLIGPCYVRTPEGEGDRFILPTCSGRICIQNTTVWRTGTRISHRIIPCASGRFLPLTAEEPSPRAMKDG